ncbi:immunodominant staphylococcal antigen IsaB family protein [Mammaliicoccus vitulinus]|uniref:Immunodominant staphylococcal antigen B n=1 Tax=Mammaliicoccus vitulinus TaxID=71237 RepID=A0A2T4PQI3_9STAP|nr:hypothetical protein [Mammaliicoccus vitulinus]PTI27941.1 hypothetical protein BU072_12640 [Mammaliicoccus vitulinus]PTI36356.1 hypothetical protein BU074_10460 [Mammaliicoccus vitulinus]RIN22602.1 hypothetical protein BU070_08640 [Mammaliicoccus vitulinus]
MKKVYQLIGIGALTTSLLLGITTVENTDHAIAAQSESETTPWYNYDGYTYNNPNFVLDHSFVEALYADNVTINGYQTEADAKTGTGGESTTVYDTKILKDKNGKVGTIMFDVKSGVVTQQAFKKAHKETMIVDEGDQFLKYGTLNQYYLASFDENGYLVHMEIGVIPQ